MRYKKTYIPNKLNHKLKLQARVCEENKKQLPVKIFMVKGLILEGCRRTAMLPIKLIFSTRIVHNIKILVLY